MFKWSCWGWKQFERNLTLKYLISSPLCLPPTLVLSVLSPANSSLVTLSATWSGAQSQNGYNEGRNEKSPIGSEEDGGEDYSFQLHLTPETPLKSVSFRECWASTISATKQQRPEKIKIITHSLLLPGLSRCSISSAALQVMHDILCKCMPRVQKVIEKCLLPPWGDKVEHRRPETDRFDI